MSEHPLPENDVRDVVPLQSAAAPADAVTPPVSPGVTAESASADTAGNSQWQRLIAITAVYGAISGLIAALSGFVGLPANKAVATFFFLLAIFFGWSTRDKRAYWRQWVTACLTVVLALLGGAALAYGPGWILASHKPKVQIRLVAKPGPTVTAAVAPTPPPAPQIVFTHPTEGDTTPVDGCLTITWQGDPPDGWAYAAGSRAAGDDLTYYEGQVQKSPSGEWTVTLTLGENGVGMGLAYQIAVIMLPKDLHDYLQAAQGNDNVTYWAGSGDPPGSRPVGHFAVVRNKKSALGSGCQ